jgi:hypothetical protein
VHPRVSSQKVKQPCGSWWQLEPPACEHAAPRYLPSRGRGPAWRRVRPPAVLRCSAVLCQAAAAVWRSRSG